MGLDGVLTLGQVGEVAVDVERASIPDLYCAVVGLEVACAGLVDPYGGLSRGISSGVSLLVCSVGVGECHVGEERCDVEGLVEELAACCSLVEHLLYCLHDHSIVTIDSSRDFVGADGLVVVAGAHFVEEVLNLLEESAIAGLVVLVLVAFELGDEGGELGVGSLRSEYSLAGGVESVVGALVLSVLAAVRSFVYEGLRLSEGFLECVDKRLLSHDFVAFEQSIGDADLSAECGIGRQHLAGTSHGELEVVGSHPVEVGVVGHQTNLYALGIVEVELEYEVSGQAVTFVVLNVAEGRLAVNGDGAVAVEEVDAAIFVGRHPLVAAGSCLVAGDTVALEDIVA